MSKHPVVLCGIGVLVFAGLIGLACLIILILAGGIFAPFEVAWHLLTGSVYFLQKNIAGISTDAGTWGPGLAASLMALAVIHWFGRSWTRHRQHTWKVSTTLALGMLLPLLFVISFLIPGVIFQIGGLTQGKWFESYRSDKPLKVRHARNIAQAAHAWATTEGGGRFPPSTAAMVPLGLFDKYYLGPQPVDGTPGEPPLYLGAGFTTQSDPALPLVISDVYSRKQIPHRTIITVGSELVEIRPEEVDAWIARAMAACERAKP